ncbi:hypothetical protein H8959_008073, partial [Pygathrix nigripes]
SRDGHREGSNPRTALMLQEMVCGTKIFTSKNLELKCEDNTVPAATESRKAPSKWEENSASISTMALPPYLAWHQVHGKSPLNSWFLSGESKSEVDNQFLYFLGCPVPALARGEHPECPKGEIALRPPRNKAGRQGLLSPALETLHLSQRRHTIRLATHNTMLQKVCSTGLLNTNPDTVRTNHLRPPSFGTGLPQSLNTAKVNLSLK